MKDALRCSCLLGRNLLISHFLGVEDIMFIMTVIISVAEFLKRRATVVVISTGEESPDQVHGDGSQSTAADAKQQSDNDAENILGAITEGGEVIAAVAEDGPLMVLWLGTWLVDEIDRE